MAAFYKDIKAAQEICKRYGIQDDAAVSDIAEAITQGRQDGLLRPPTESAPMTIELGKHPDEGTQVTTYAIEDGSLIHSKAYVRYCNQRVDVNGDENECEPYVVLDGEFDADQLVTILKKLVN